MPGELLSQLGGLRFALVAVTTLVLVWWTYRRLQGDATDPSINLDVGGGSGYAGVLLTGFVAVAFVAGGWILGLGPEIMRRPALLAIPVGFLAAHAYIEVRES